MSEPFLCLRIERYHHVRHPNTPESADRYDQLLLSTAICPKDSTLFSIHTLPPSSEVLEECRRPLRQQSYRKRICCKFRKLDGLWLGDFLSEFVPGSTSAYPMFLQAVLDDLLEASVVCYGYTGEDLGTCSIASSQLRNIYSFSVIYLCPS